MLKIMFLERVISFENSFNGFLYFLKNIPGFGKNISEYAFERNGAKKLLSYVNFIVSFLISLFGKALYSVIFFLVPYIVMRNMVTGNYYQYDDVIINTFAIMTCICGSFIHTAIMSDSETDYMMINIMRIDPVKHYRGKVCFKLISDIAGFFLILSIIGIDINVCVKLILLLAASRLAGEYVRLLIYGHIPALYKRIIIPDVVIIIASVYYSYVNPFYKKAVPQVADIITDNKLLLICIIGVICFILIWFYGNYNSVACRHITRPDNTYDEQLILRKKIKSSDARTVVERNALVGKAEKKKGEAYLNALFFERSKNSIRKGIHTRNGLVALVGVAASIWAVAGGTEAKEFIWNGISNASVQLVLISLILSSGYGICRNIYYNCDRLLSNFSYYRTQKVLVNNYHSRLKTMLLKCIEPYITAGVFIVLASLAAGHIKDAAVYLPVVIELILLGILMCIIHVAFYHIFNPYDENMKAANRMFTLSYAVVVAVSAGIMAVKINAVILMCITIALIIVFSGVSEYIIRNRIKI